MRLIMFLFKCFRFRAGSALLALLVAGFPLTALADISGLWNLTGTLRVDSKVAGKAVTVKKTNHAFVADFAISESLSRVVLSSNALELSGQWLEATSTYVINPDASSVRTLLRVIEKDLRARSGFEVSLEEDKVKFTGKKRKDGKLDGSLSIKTRVFFLGAADKKGSVAVTYTFTGSRKI